MVTLTNNVRLTDCMARTPTIHVSMSEFDICRKRRFQHEHEKGFLWDRGTHTDTHEDKQEAAVLMLMPECLSVGRLDNCTVKLVDEAGGLGRRLKLGTTV